MFAQRRVLLLHLPSLANACHLPDISAVVDRQLSCLHRPVEGAEVHEEGEVVVDEIRVVLVVVVAAVAVVVVVAVAGDIEMAVTLAVVEKCSLDQGSHRTEGLEVEYPAHCILRTPLDRCSLHSWREERTPLGRSSLGSRAVPLGLPIILHSM